MADLSSSETLLGIGDVYLSSTQASHRIALMGHRSYDITPEEAQLVFTPAFMHVGQALDLLADSAPADTTDEMLQCWVERTLCELNALCPRTDVRFTNIRFARA